MVRIHIDKAHNRCNYDDRGNYADHDHQHSSEVVGKCHGCVCLLDIAYYFISFSGERVYFSFLHMMQSVVFSARELKMKSDTSFAVSSFL